MTELIILISHYLPFYLSTEVTCNRQLSSWENERMLTGKSNEAIVYRVMMYANPLPIL